MQFFLKAIMNATNIRRGSKFFSPKCYMHVVFFFLILNSINLAKLVRNIDLQKRNI